MKDVNPANLPPKNSTQQQIPDELTHKPLHDIPPTEEDVLALLSPLQMLNMRHSI